MLTELQKKTAQAIVQVFETSKLGGSDAYSQVTVLQGDTGGLTYGREQTTLMSGNLYLLIKDYVERQGAFAQPLSLYLERMADCDASLNRDQQLRGLLVNAGHDPIMLTVQDDFFDRVYWLPAFKTASALGLTLPLSFSVIYDSQIHGSLKRIINMVGLPRPMNVPQEQYWINTFLQDRYNWLKNHGNPLLRKTVYRQEAYFSMIQANRWNLELPLIVRGVRITPELLGGTNMCKLDGLDDCDPPEVSAKDGSDVMRLLRIKSPPLVGQDVAAVQHALVNAGYPLTPDGVFGPATANCVQMFQAAQGLKADGIVGNATRTALGL